MYTMQAGWGDMDFNAHMANTAYLDKAATARMKYFSANGFPMTEFVRLRFGPVILRDEVEYFREIHLLEEFTVTFELAGVSADGRKFRVRNTFLRPDGKIAARVTSLVAWLNLVERKLITPPPALSGLLESLTRAEDFSVME